MLLSRLAMVGIGLDGFLGLTDAESSADLGGGSIAYVVAGIMTAIAAALAIKVVSVITDRQEERFAKVGVVALPTPPPTFSFEHQ